jgi:hypothetical protein
MPAASPSRAGVSVDGLRMSRPEHASEQDADRLADEIVSGRPLRARAMAAAAGTAGDAAPTANQLATIRPVVSGGRPLDRALRERYETSLGVELAGVRVHDDANADRAARALGAEAFAVGNHVVFGAGRYAPGNDRGERLLAHELVHVAQQQQGGLAVIQRKLSSEPARARELEDVSPELKQEAEQLISAHTRFFNLDEARLGATLAARAEAGRFDLVYAVIASVHDTDRDDLAVAFFRCASDDQLTAWLGAPRSLRMLGWLQQYLMSDLVFEDERQQLLRLDRLKKARDQREWARSHPGKTEPAPVTLDGPVSRKSPGQLAAAFPQARVAAFPEGKLRHGDELEGLSQSQWYELLSHPHREGPSLVGPLAIRVAGVVVKHETFLVWSEAGHIVAWMPISDLPLGTTRRGSWLLWRDGRELQVIQDRPEDAETIRKRFPRWSERDVERYRSAAGVQNRSLEHFLAVEEQPGPGTTGPRGIQHALHQVQESERDTLTELVQGTFKAFSAVANMEDSKRGLQELGEAGGRRLGKVARRTPSAQSVPPEKPPASGGGEQEIVPPGHESQAEPLKPPVRDETRAAAARMEAASKEVDPDPEAMAAVKDPLPADRGLPGGPSDQGPSSADPLYQARVRLARVRRATPRYTGEREKMDALAAEGKKLARELREAPAPPALPDLQKRTRAFFKGVTEHETWLNKQRGRLKGEFREQRTQDVVGQHYERPFGKGDNAVRRGLKLEGKRTADIVGIHKVYERWLIAENKGGSPTTAVEQLRVTVGGIERSPPEQRVGFTADNVDLRIFVDERNFALMQPSASGREGCWVEDGFLIDAGGFVTVDVGGTPVRVRVSVEPAARPSRSAGGSR